MSTGSDAKQLELIRESLYSPEAEEEAKRLFLEEVYKQVRSAWRPVAPNGGRLADLPECVRKGEICKDDVGLAYNALRVLAARYMTRDETGRWMETPSMVFRRVAEGLGRRTSVGVERLYRLLVEGRFMFNSPTLFNMYCDGARGTLSACYVTPVYDSMDGIMDAARVQALTFKWGGGQGFSFSELRPRYDIVRGTSGVASGPLSFMRLFDMVTEVVKQGGKRRGANMGILHAWHPDIYNPHFDPWAALYNTLPPQIRDLLKAFKRLIEELEAEGYTVDPEVKRWVAWLVEAGEKKPWVTVEEAGFVQAKEPPLQDTNLTNFNISVAANDAFMKAVLEDGEWWMVNPRFSEENGVYRLHYTVSRATNPNAPGVKAAEELQHENPYVGVFEDILENAKRRALTALEERRRATGWPTSPDEKNPIVWRTRARDVFKKAVENAWAGGDPGFIYIDNHNKWHPTPWLGMVNATNPCGEQPLYPFESCNLGSVNLEKYVVCEGTRCYFDLEAFARDVAAATEALDAVIDANNHPDWRQRTANLFTRKVGLGFMGLASALARLGIPYDSDEGVAFTLVATAALEAFSWRRSWELGAEKGPAPAFRCKRYDWEGMECVEEASPEWTLRLHTPGLRKAGMVSGFEEGWLTLHYHKVSIDEWGFSLLRGVARERVLATGKVRLLPAEKLENIAKSVFGFTRETAEEAARLPAAKVVEDPVLLTALAVYDPGRAWEKLVEYGRGVGAEAPRNTVTTTVAPTGTISIIAGTSSGIEPFFAIVFKRVVTVGTFLEVVRPFRDALLKLAEETGATREHLKLVYEAVNSAKGSIRRALAEGLAERLRSAGAPEEFIRGLEGLARAYPSTHDIDVWWHVAHQAAAQLYVDQAISKTINLERDTPIEAAYTAFILGWLAGLKGVTIFREGSKAASVIQTGSGKTAERRLLRRKRRSMRMQVPKKRAVLTGEVKDEVIVDMFTGSECKTCEL
ncbi:ribonucleoside-diphosphate reductase, adenosylcobalamin-dependent [Pyrolobus fumarii 1A]|uniref:Vitamin B12-dependent ribonucleotide reductase n=1 Tax=Pyrolobus fumarii (strain DSM 11204 / 1A) TaxID=694429 RepID=G0EGZ9_PYRF1|nr:adenosylcobalamin-dependent ribonucleoside-diphosphate reductase [Pyrolobus fumarii]AEM38449.1 ribonucleoside-diphosphate reductase, adenosylcobalamin-dependent [Pyrolobus fumarii 1A]